MDLILEKSRDMKATKSAVWKVLTDPTYIKDWLGVEIENGLERRECNHFFIFMGRKELYR
ncbi:hypothetical protein ACQKK5_05690 [Brevibacillus panacihumi]|uniref:hypothetical protein n=1 Tax=Brevibacillus panacihumi TaxID=497735 RepID=UPI003CFC38F5